MNIILIGFKSCGKSTIGQALSLSIEMSFIDTDTLLEALHTTIKNESLSFRKIYQKYGQSYFRGLERQVLDQIGQIDNCVIAAGGGTFIYHPLTNETRSNAKIIYLEVAPDILLNRIKTGGIPAFFKGPDLKKDFERYFKERVPIYKQLADHTIDISHCDIAQAVEQIRYNLGL